MIYETAAQRHIHIMIFLLKYKYQHHYIMLKESFSCKTPMQSNPSTIYPMLILTGIFCTYFVYMLNVANHKYLVVHVVT